MRSSSVRRSVLPRLRPPRHLHQRHGLATWMPLSTAGTSTASANLDGAVDFLFALAFPIDFDREDATNLRAGDYFPGDLPFAITGF